MISLKNTFAALSMISLMASSAFAEITKSDLAKRSDAAVKVLQQTTLKPDASIPRSLLQRAACVATFPGVIKGGFVVGGMVGQGLVSCRVAGGWSEPVYLDIAGGNWGLQVGLESVDIVLVFLNTNAVERFSHDNFTLGGGASVAAGPLGRDAQAGTDYELKSEIYSYSIGRGLYAGLTLNGTAITVDKEADAVAYNRNISAHNILTSNLRAMISMSNPYAQTLTSLLQ